MLGHIRACWGITGHTGEEQGMLGHSRAQQGALGTMQRGRLAGWGQEQGPMGKDVFAGQCGIQKKNES